MKIVEAVNSIQVTQADISAFETEHNLSLPEDYSSFLIRENGGRPQPSTFVFRDIHGETKAAVDWFYSLSPDKSYGITENIGMLEGIIPVGMVPIGCDALGNQLFLGANGIFFWDHELGDSCSQEDLIKIADSFDQFLGLLS